MRAASPVKQRSSSETVQVPPAWWHGASAPRSLSCPRPAAAEGRPCPVRTCELSAGIPTSALGHGAQCRMPADF